MNRVETVRGIIDKKILEQTDKEIIRTGFIHLYGVAQYCTLLAIKRGLDIELATLSGMLHDIYSYTVSYTKNHAELGALKANEILTSTGLFNTDEVIIVVTSIYNHSDKKNIHDEYSELLKDADTLQNSLYNPLINIKHKKRLKSVLKELNINVKIRELKGELKGELDLES